MEKIIDILNGQIEEYFCIDCGSLLDSSTPGIVAGAWLRTDGNKDIVEPVPGGIIFGKKLGFVCNDCHDKEYEAPANNFMKTQSIDGAGS